MANEFMGWLIGNEASAKELSLDQASAKIRDAIYQKLQPSQMLGGVPAIAQSEPTYWVSEIFAGYAIVEKGAEHFKVRFSVTDQGVEVGDEMIPVERVWVEKAMPDADKEMPASSTETASGEANAESVSES